MYYQFQIWSFWCVCWNPDTRCPKSDTMPGGTPSFRIDGRLQSISCRYASNACQISNVRGCACSIVEVQGKPLLVKKATNSLRRECCSPSFSKGSRCAPAICAVNRSTRFHLAMHPSNVRRSALRLSSARGADQSASEVIPPPSFSLPA